MPSFRSPVRRRAPLGATRAVPALATLALLAACDVQRGGDDAGAARESASGEVAGGPSWSAPTLTAAAGVPIAEVRTALARRMDAARPAPLTEAQWRHARALYKRYGQTPLWFDAEGPDRERATALLRALVDPDRDALRLDAYPLPALARAMQALEAGRPTAEQVA